MWFGLAKMALQAGAKVYSNKQRTKMAMADAALLHAERMARGEESYQGKLLEASIPFWPWTLFLVGWPKGGLNVIPPF